MKKLFKKILVLMAIMLLFAADAWGGAAIDYTSNTSPVETDQLLGIDDPAGTWAINRFPISNVWTSVFKGYADALYQPDSSVLDKYAGVDPSANILSTLGAATYSAAVALWKTDLDANIKVVLAAPGAIGGTTPAVITGTTITGSSFVSSAADGSRISYIPENTNGNEPTPTAGYSGFYFYDGALKYFYDYTDTTYSFATLIQTSALDDTPEDDGDKAASSKAVYDERAATVTLTNKTIDGDDNTLNDIGYGSIKSTSRSGDDATLVTGTAGTSTYAAVWNADGDLVDGPGVPFIASDWTAASTSAQGKVELTIVSEMNTGTSDTLAATPDAIAGSYAGTKDVGWTIVDSDTAITVADGKQAYAVPASLVGMNLIDVTASVHDLNSAASDTTTVVIRRVRGATAADMTSTGVTIGYDEYTASDETVDTSNDDLALGDKIYVDVNAITTAAQKGLSVTCLFRLP